MKPKHYIINGIITLLLVAAFGAATRQPTAAVKTFLDTPSSANFVAMLSDENGTGTVLTSNGSLADNTGLPISTGVSGLGTNQATALAANLDSATTNRKCMITMDCGASLNPADGATYFMGTNHGFPPVNGVAGFGELFFASDCHIKYCRFVVVPTSALGSAEDATLYIRLNNTTDTEVSASVKANATQTEVTNSALDIAVSAGDRIELKLVCPTYTTNPTVVYFFAQIEIEYD